MSGGGGGGGGVAAQPASLLESASLGDVAALTYALGRGVNPNDHDFRGWTPLMAACYYRQVQCVQLLLEHRADVSVASLTSKWTALHCAVEGNSLQSVLLLLAAGASIMAKNSQNETPLSRAIVCGHKEMVKEMLLAVNEQIKQALLIEAAQTGDVATVNALAEQPGFKFNTGNFADNNNTALHYAVYNYFPDVVQVLLAFSASPSPVNAMGHTPLHYAAFRNNVAAADLLLAQNEVKKNAQDKDKGTPLHVAVANGFVEMAERLLNAGADRNVTDKNGRRPVDLVTQVQSPEARSRISSLFALPQPMQSYAQVTKGVAALPAAQPAAAAYVMPQNQPVAMASVTAAPQPSNPAEMFVPQPNAIFATNGAAAFAEQAAGHPAQSIASTAGSQDAHRKTTKAAEMLLPGVSDTFSAPKAADPAEHARADPAAGNRSGAFSSTGLDDAYSRVTSASVARETLVGNHLPSLASVQTAAAAHINSAAPVSAMSGPATHSATGGPVSITAVPSQLPTAATATGSHNSISSQTSGVSSVPPTTATTSYDSSSSQTSGVAGVPLQQSELAHTTNTEPTHTTNNAGQTPVPVYSSATPLATQSGFVNTVTDCGQAQASAPGTTDVQASASGATSLQAPTSVASQLPPQSASTGSAPMYTPAVSSLPEHPQKQESASSLYDPHGPALHSVQPTGVSNPPPEQMPQLSHGTTPQPAAPSPAQLHGVTARHEPTASAPHVAAQTGGATTLPHDQGTVAPRQAADVSAAFPGTQSATAPVKLRPDASKPPRYATAANTTSYGAPPVTVAAQTQAAAAPAHGVTHDPMSHQSNAPLSPTAASTAMTHAAAAAFVPPALPALGSNEALQNSRPFVPSHARSESGQPMSKAFAALEHLRPAAASAPAPVHVLAAEKPVGDLSQFITIGGVAAFMQPPAVTAATMQQAPATMPQQPVVMPTTATTTAQSFVPHQAAFPAQPSLSSQAAATVQPSGYSQAPAAVSTTIQRLQSENSVGGGMSGEDITYRPPPEAGRAPNDGDEDDDEEIEYKPNALLVRQQFPVDEEEEEVVVENVEVELRKPNLSSIQVAAVLRKLNAPASAQQAFRERNINGSCLHKNFIIEEGFLIDNGVTVQKDRETLRSIIAEMRSMMTVNVVVEKNDLTFGQLVYSSASSLVHKGTLGGTPVAIKQILRDTQTTPQDVIEEAQLVKSIPTHPNVLQYFGVCIAGEDIYLVLEYCEYGSLESFLRHNPMLPVSQLVHFCTEISLGMLHLSQHMVHRDLATRNIMLGHANNASFHIIAKIADFGLARPLRDGGVSRRIRNTPLPVPWTPNEVVLEHREHTPASDVWMFATTVWEMFMGVPDQKDYSGRWLQRVPDPQRHQDPPLQRPQRMPEDLYALLCHCWARDPLARPSFEVVHAQLLGLDSVLE